MSYYRNEPPYQHGTPARVGILLINLGTPTAPTGKALRPYLKQFLSDRRVVEIPRAIWWLILNGIILNIRPKKSAEKYAMVWTDEGSPLYVHTQKQAKLLKGYLSTRINSPFAVEFAFRYGEPSISSAISKLKAANCDRILMLPLYPQYSASTTASAMDDAWRTLLRTRNVPAIRTVRSYHDHPAYIESLADSVQQHWSIHGKPEILIMSFHGVPRFSLDKGDPYHCECHKTGRLLAEALKLDKSQYMVCFQSRFGKAEWLKPYLAPTLAELGKRQIKRLGVVCPGFSSDCLETLEEVAMEGKEIFQHAGGGEYHYIPALNENDKWIHALTDIALENLQGWVSDHWDATTSQEESVESRNRAIEMGARQ